MHTQRYELAHRIGKLAHTLEAVGDEPNLVMPRVDDVLDILPTTRTEPHEAEQLDTWILAVSAAPSDRTLPMKGKRLARLFYT